MTDSRVVVDLAACMRHLTEVHYPKAERIRVVLDNLPTRGAVALYEAFPPWKARRLLERLEFHYVPKHASSLNVIERKIGVLHGQCLNRRIGTQAAPRIRNRHLGTTAKCRPLAYQMDVHN